MHEVDVVVIGGGVAGLCVLRKLRLEAPETSVVLAIGDHGVGAGQTCHGHTMLHRGHYQIGRFILPPTWVEGLSGSGLDRRLQDVLRTWREHPDLHGRLAGRDIPDMEALLWLGAEAWASAGAPVAGPEEHGKNLAIYLDTTEGRSHLRERWRPVAASRLAELGSPPAGFDVWEVREEWVDPNQITAWLVDGPQVPLREFLVPGAATLERDDDTVIVTVGARRFRTHQVVIAAGEANVALLDRYAPVTADSDRHRRAVWTELYELVMRGPEASGPSLLGARAGGIRWRGGPPLSKMHHGLLSAHRAGPGEMTWIFTDGIETKKGAGPLDAWVRLVVGVLETKLGLKRTDLLWSARSRRTLEWGVEPAQPTVGHWSIERCNEHYLSGRLDAMAAPNVMFVWPTKLTLAPLLAEDVFRYLDRRPRFPQPNLRDSRGDLPDLRFACAPWDADEDLRPWDAFVAGLAEETPPPLP